jgi:hypothetical protein
MADKTMIKAGETSNVDVLLTAPAPESNTRVYLETDSDMVQIPSQIDVPAGWTRGSFAATVKPELSETKNINIKAVTYGRHCCG